MLVRNELIETYASGAIRGTDETKGRCDLMPLGVIAVLTGDRIIDKIDQYIYTGMQQHLYDALTSFIDERYNGNEPTAILELSLHYRDGLIDHPERNWEKGLPLHGFINSAVRHYLKYSRGDKDEPHDRAFMWNLFGALWTQINRPEMIDLPFKEKKDNEE